MGTMPSREITYTGYRCWWMHLKNVCVTVLVLGFEKVEITVLIGLNLCFNPILFAGQIMSGTC